MLGRRCAVLPAFLLCFACADAAPREADPRAAVAAALADPLRRAQADQDARRKPLELVSFSGVQAGDKVLDLIPGDGYWTRIFSRIVGPRGKVYGVWPQNYARYSVGKVSALRQLAADPAFANVAVAVQPTNVLAAPEPLDLVWASQNYHDYPAEFMGESAPSVLNDAAFKLLKPGGIYIVIDHAAAPGRGMDDVEAMHRIDPELVKHQVIAAGFEFVGASDALANPADDHSRRVFDPMVRGNTDKFALKFRKPL